MSESLSKKNRLLTHHPQNIFAAACLLAFLSNLPIHAGVEIAPTAITSTFDFDNEGWTVIGDAESVIPDYIETGGNPGGYISADDTIAGGVWYWNAPARYLGDQSKALGTSLTFDLMQSNTLSQFENPDIRVISDSLSIVFDTAFNPGTDWTSYDVLLLPEAGWLIGSLSGEPATLEDMETVFANITSLQIRGEFRTGADTGGLDNVTMVPEPGWLPFSVLAMLAAIMLRRRR